MTFFDPIKINTSGCCCLLTRFTIRSFHFSCAFNTQFVITSTNINRTRLMILMTMIYVLIFFSYCVLLFDSQTKKRFFGVKITQDSYILPFLLVYEFWNEMKIELCFQLQFNCTYLVIMNTYKTCVAGSLSHIIYIYLLITHVQDIFSILHASMRYNQP